MPMVRAMFEISRRSRVTVAAQLKLAGLAALIGAILSFATGNGIFWALFPLLFLTLVIGARISAYMKSL